LEAGPQHAGAGGKGRELQPVPVGRFEIDAVVDRRAVCLATRFLPRKARRVRIEDCV
jgi:hypothetical protein